ncbi:MAG: cupin domain-containing protein [Pelagibacteraceae bacterium]|nr:cupin domain-containing protein [Pelagibacteraceae bacterium]
MTYKPSPKPDFDKPTHIKYDLIEPYMWGDEKTGKVKDWIYVSNLSLHQIIFGLEPKGNFKHSDQYRTIFGADEFLYVLSGVLIINNPENGETHKVNAGESVFFRKDTWHHGFNYSDDYLQVLEFFSPPPLTGTSGLYAKEKKLLEKSIYKRQDISFHNNDFKNENTFKIIKKDNLVWSLEGPNQEVLIGNYVKTEFLNVKLITLLPFQKTHVFKFDNNTSYLSLNDNIKVSINNNNQEYKLNKKDGLYIRANNKFTLENKNDFNVEIILCEGL